VRVKILIACVIVGTASLVLCAGLLAEGALPLEGEPAIFPVTPAATSTATPAVAPTDTAAKTVVSMAERLGADITKQVAAVEKIIKQHDDEMAKPEGKRDVAKAMRLKLQAAAAYKQVALKAKGDAGRLKKEEKQPFLDKFEQPNREKAIAIYLELASAAQDKKDYRTALAMFQAVLQIEPQNTSAQAGITNLATLAKTPTGTAAVGTVSPTSTDISGIFQKQ
jgi:tetratricopeptide (TPR) repeat protein